MTDVKVISLFFFKQKTAYEIGLGIPAEPLFRSRKSGSAGKECRFSRNAEEERFSRNAEIGRASCRERVYISAGAARVQKEGGSGGQSVRAQRSRESKKHQLKSHTEVEDDTNERA